jgi:hypothetical protein
MELILPMRLKNIQQMILVCMIWLKCSRMVCDVYRPIIESNDFNILEETDILKTRLVQMVKVEIVTLETMKKNFK